MFERLRQHWKVNNKDLFLIFCTFAVTGTLTAFISRQITTWLDIERLTFMWWALKVLVLIFGYQVVILVVGFCFGQFKFFWNYEKKILRRMGFKKLTIDNLQFAIGNRQEAMSNNQESKGLTNNKPQINIAIFASGAGSNAEKIIEYFTSPPTPLHPDSYRERGGQAPERRVNVALIVCNNPTAGVLDIAAMEKVPFLIIKKNKFYEDGYRDELKKFNIGFIVLAGFMWKIPSILIDAYPDKIINIHPALLPEFGGKGMYGLKVHEAVISAGKKESGITIHYVDELYDHGKIIFQSKCTVDENENAESLAEKIHALEHAHYAKVIEEIITVHQTAKSF